MSKVAVVTENRSDVTVYSDFFTDFSRNAVTGQLNKKTNAEAVKQSVRNLLLTDKLERLYQPSVGAGLRALLFENATPFTQMQVQSYINEAIRNHEPRAELISTELEFKNDQHTAEIVVTFAIINIEDPVTITIGLERTR